MGYDMTQGKPMKLVFGFAMPMMIGSLFQQLYNTVDAVIVGKYEGPDALAAIGAAFPLMFFMMSVIIGMTMGVSVIISQLYGAGDRNGLQKAVSTSMIFLVGMSVVMTAVGLVIIDPLLALTRTPADIHLLCADYLRVIVWGGVFNVLYNAYTAILRGMGDSKTPVLFLAAAALSNIVLDLIFVVQFRMGVKGVAIATVMAQAISAILCVVYSSVKIPILRLRLKELTFDKEMFRHIVSFGVPTAIQQSIVSLGMMSVQGLVNSFGSVTMAGYTAANKIDSFAMQPSMNFGNALSSFVGQNVGAGDFERSQKGLRETLKMSVAFCVMASVIMVAFSHQLLSIFMDEGNEAVIAVGAEYLTVMASCYFLMATMHAFSGFFRGTGYTRMALYMSITSLGVRIVTSYALAPVIGASAIWWGLPVGWLTTVLLGMYAYRQGKWKNFALVKARHTDWEEDMPEKIWAENE